MSAFLEWKAQLISAIVLVATLIESYSLLNSLKTEPIGLANPTPVFWNEVNLIVIFFAIYVILSAPVRQLLVLHTPKLTDFFRRKVKIPLAGRLAALIFALYSIYVFGFWMTADVLGGVSGYGYSFETHPLLNLFYNETGLRYLDILSNDFGLTTRGAFGLAFFIVAVICLVIFQLDRGIGVALKDTMTLFVGPCLIAFELALWYYATPDMSWHVATFLYMGGCNDGGFRSGSCSGDYIFSNWLVFSIAIALVASRLPWLSYPSKMLWKEKEESNDYRFVA